jgi:PST family polysaccharide transporter
MPTYSRLQDNTEKLTKAFSMVIFFLVRVLMPFVLVFAVLPLEFIRVIGDQWLTAVPVLRILAVGALLSPLFENMKQLLLAKGRTDALLKIRVVQLGFFLPGMYFLVLYFGISGAAVAVLLNYGIGVAGAIFFVRRIISVAWLREIVLPLVFAGVTAGIVLLFPAPDLHKGAIVQFLASALYLTALYFLLEVLVEWRRIKNHYLFIKFIMNEPDQGEKLP